MGRSSLWTAINKLLEATLRLYDAFRFRNVNKIFRISGVHDKDAIILAMNKNLRRNRDALDAANILRIVHGYYISVERSLGRLEVLVRPDKPIAPTSLIMFMIEPIRGKVMRCNVVTEHRITGEEALRLTSMLGVVVGSMNHDIGDGQRIMMNNENVDRLLKEKENAEAIKGLLLARAIGLLAAGQATTTDEVMGALTAFIKKHEVEL